VEGSGHAQHRFNIPKIFGECEESKEELEKTASLWSGIPIRTSACEVGVLTTKPQHFGKREDDNFYYDNSAKITRSQFVKVLY
jgi:hypothetical protein